MNTPRRIYEMLMMASRAYATWDYQASMNIVRDRRKIIILLVMLLPVFFISVVLAAGSLPDILGGKEAYSPAFYTPFIFGVSILIGLAAGLITGCIGAGGGFIITPALMSAGIKGILAVGTDLFHIFAKAIMGTAVHRKLGNVSVGLAVAFLFGSGIGVIGGGVINRTLYEANPVLSDTFISILYVVLLGFLGFYALSDFLRLRDRGVDIGAHAELEPYSDDLRSRKKTVSERLQSSRIPPLIKFDEDLVPGGKQIPGIFVSACGLIVGFVAAIMGVGGGFLTFPMFVYILGVSSFTTVGTDILQIIFTAGFAAISQYAIYGFIFYTLAMGMLLGSLIGVQLGAMTTRVVKGIYIRGFYAVAILAGFANRLFALPGKLAELEVVAIPESVTGVLTVIGNVAFFLVVGVFAIWVISTFILNIGLLREEA